MWTLRRPDVAPGEVGRNRWLNYWRRVPTLIATVSVGVFLPLAAPATSAQTAIESLEGCSKKERTSGCVKILKRQSAGAGKQAITAQVRGGRIIWYEYDKKSGKVRRTN